MTKIDIYTLPDHSNVSIKRQATLCNIAKIVKESIRTQKRINLIFVCTHNSRRSQAAELWAHVFCQMFDITNLSIYSAGTEKTAFNYRMLNAAKRWKFRVRQDKEKEGQNIEHPFSDNNEIFFSSKTIFSKQVPTENVIAIMTCSHADKNCPIIPGALHRLPLRYEDPGQYDGTPIEQKGYDDSFSLIGSEMHFLFKTIAQIK